MPRLLYKLRSRAMPNGARIRRSQFVRKLLVLDDVVGAFALTGQTATLRIGIGVAADAGAFSLNGQSASLLTARKVAAAAGSLALTGQDAGFVRGKGLVADAGSLVLSGQAATLKAARRVSADAGAYALTGQAATPRLFDPHFANVQLLLHMDGADGSTTFTNSAGSGITCTAAGNAQIDTAQSVFGGASGLFDGNGDTVRTANNQALEPGSGEFTIEFRMRPANTSQVSSVLAKRTGTSTYAPFLFAQSGTSLLLYMSSTGSSWNVASGVNVGTLAANTWAAVALSRVGNNIHYFFNGTLVGTISSSATLHDNNEGFGIGGESAPSAFFNGHIDELRYTVGVGRYSASYTLATKPFLDS
jgi:hypothetical protein